ncbi:MAG: hypothetical protein RR942_01090 [Romboutsia sp.]|uniref:hypothetical protein n=1 Tax=Paraclostridium sp. TaxID=2023273 RepID=UPI003A9E0D3A
MSRLIYAIFVSVIFYFIMKKLYKPRQLKRSKEELKVKGKYNEGELNKIEKEADNFCIITSIAFFSMMYFGMLLGIIIAIILSLIYPKLDLNKK